MLCAQDVQRMLYCQRCLHDRMHTPFRSRRVYAQPSVFSRSAYSFAALPRGDENSRKSVYERRYVCSQAFIPCATAFSLPSPPKHHADAEHHRDMFDILQTDIRAERLSPLAFAFPPNIMPSGFHCFRRRCRRFLFIGCRLHPSIFAAAFIFTPPSNIFLSFQLAGWFSLIFSFQFSADTRLPLSDVFCPRFAHRHHPPPVLPFHAHYAECADSESLAAFARIDGRRMVARESPRPACHDATPAHRHHTPSFALSRCAICAPRTEKISARSGDALCAQQRAQRAAANSRRLSTQPAS